MRDILTSGREAKITQKSKGFLSGANKALQGAQRDNGAAMIELALVLILLVMLLVGTVSAAIAYGRNSAIQNAAREASRFAATLPDVANNFADVVTVAQNAATGDLESTAPGYFVCVAYVKEIGNGGSNSRLTDGSPPSLPGDNTCFDDERPDDEPRVQVVAGRTTEFNALVFSADLDLQSQAVARYEREP